MNKCILIFLVALPRFLFSQFGYMSMGYNANLFESEQLNFVVDRYNETRTYLDEEMAHPNYFDGFEIHAGGGDNVLVDIGFAWRSSKVSASGVDASGTNQQRDLKYKFGSFEFGIGYVAVKGEIKIAAGYNQTLGSEKAYSRVDLAEEVNSTDYDLVFKSFNPGADIFILFIFPVADGNAILLRPYYHFSYGTTDYAGLNEALNPATAAADPQVLESSFKGFGASLQIGFGRF